MRYFVAVAHARNFTRAAELCNVSQPALTRAVQKLEYELGGDLFRRERQLSELTELGQFMLPMLERTLAAAEAARNSAKQFNTNEATTLRIGSAPSISASIMTKPLSELSRQISGLQVDLIEDKSRHLTDALVEGQIHAAVTGHCENPLPRLCYRPLFEERYVIVISRCHPFAQFKEIPLSALHDTVWLGRDACEVKNLFERTCFESGTPPKFGHWGGRESHLQHMAAAGLGAVLAPEHVPLLPTLVARSIEGSPVRRQVGLLTIAGRRRSSALAALAKIGRLHNWRHSFQPTASKEEKNEAPAPAN